MTVCLLGCSKFAHSANARIGYVGYAVIAAIKRPAYTFNQLLLKLVKVVRCFFKRKK